MTSMTSSCTLECSMPSTHGTLPVFEAPPEIIIPNQISDYRSSLFMQSNTTENAYYLAAWVGCSEAHKVHNCFSVKTT